MMDILITIISFLFMLSFLVLIHELGHFFVARFLGIEVQELGLGFPPKFKSLNRHGIEYSLNLIPFGGFVRLKGESDPGLPGGFASKRLRDRFLVIFAGPLMNFILAWVIFSGLSLYLQDIKSADLVIESVVVNSPAEMAGLQPGDRLVLINNVKIDTLEDLTELVNDSERYPLSVSINRQGKSMDLTLIPRDKSSKDEGKIGVKLKLENVETRSIPVWKAPYVGLKWGISNTSLIFNEIKNMINGDSKPDISGPLGIAQVTGEAVEAGFLPFLYLVGILSLNLGILNLLPIPSLDGGRLPFLFLEFIRRGKKIPPQMEATVHFVGFIILLSLIFIVTVGVDIPRLLNKD